MSCWRETEVSYPGMWRISRIVLKPKQIYGNMNPTGTLEDLANTAGTLEDLASTAGTLEDLASTAGTLEDLASTVGMLEDLASTVRMLEDLASTAGTLEDLASTVGMLEDLASTAGALEESREDCKNSRGGGPGGTRELMIVGCWIESKYPGSTCVGLSLVSRLKCCNR